MKTYLNVVLPAPPFIYTRSLVLKTDIMLISLLCIQLALLAFSMDFYALLNIACALLGAVSVEYLFQYMNKCPVKFSTQVITTGLLIGFFMPISIGFVFVFFLSAFSLFVSKIIFGGSGKNWINPVAAAACIAYISHPESFPSALYGAALIRGHGGFFQVLEANGLLKLKTDFSVTSLLNSVLLHGIGVTLPEGYVSLFLNSTSVVPAFRYNIISLLSSVVLFAFKAADYILPSCFLITYGIAVFVFSQVPITGAYFSGDILAALLTGGILFSAFFVLTEPSSSPKTKYGKALCGFLTGVIAFCICGSGASPAGAVFSVLFANMITPLIEKMEVKIQAGKRKLYE